MLCLVAPGVHYLAIVAVRTAETAGYPVRLPADFVIQVQNLFQITFQLSRDVGALAFQHPRDRWPADTNKRRRIFSMIIPWLI